MTAGIRRRVRSATSLGWVVRAPHVPSRPPLGRIGPITLRSGVLFELSHNFPPFYIPFQGGNFNAYWESLKQEVRLCGPRPSLSPHLSPWLSFSAHPHPHPNRFGLCKAPPIIPPGVDDRAQIVLIGGLASNPNGPLTLAQRMGPVRRGGRGPLQLGPSWSPYVPSHSVAVLGPLPVHTERSAL